MTKVSSTPEAAVADIPDGSIVAIAGFGVGHSYPNSLVAALKEQGARNLCVVANSLGGSSSDYRPELLLENGQISKLILSFSARPGFPSLAEERAAAGQVQLEMVPQGILVERMRAAGAGLPAFYSPVTVGTPLAQGKEAREFAGKPYVLELALPVDYALLRGHRADADGNIEFRGSSMHFHPSFAKAARIAIVEVEEIVDSGVIAPERVGLPGIFVSRVVLTTKKMAVPKGALGRRAPDSRREYFGKPALSRLEIARRAAALLPEHGYVNLGSGLPTLVASHIAGRQITQLERARSSRGRHWRGHGPDRRGQQAHCRHGTRRQQRALEARAKVQLSADRPPMRRHDRDRSCVARTPRGPVRTRGSRAGLLR